MKTEKLEWTKVSETQTVAQIGETIFRILHQEDIDKYYLLIGNKVASKTAYEFPVHIIDRVEGIDTELIGSMIMAITEVQKDLEKLNNKNNKE